MSWFDRNLFSEFKEAAERERAFLAQRDRRRDREREDQKAERDEATENDLISVVEQTAQLREIEERLDALEVQVTQALIENDRQLDVVRDRIALMLSRAVVLPDGRRVFKTEDGTQVFDEHGEEVSPEVIDPDSIDDGLTSWEEFKAQKDLQTELEAEREQLLDLQQDIDAARNAAENGDLDMSELDALEAEFGEIENRSAEPSQSAGNSAPKSDEQEVATKDTTTKFQI